MTPAGLQERRDQDMKKRRNHHADSWTHVAMEAVKGGRSVSELDAEFGVHPTVIHKWMKNFVDGAAESSSAVARKPAGLRGLPQLNPNQSAGAGSRLNHTEIIPKVGDEPTHLTFVMLFDFRQLKI